MNLGQHRALLTPQLAPKEAANRTRRERVCDGALALPPPKKSTKRLEINANLAAACHPWESWRCERLVARRRATQLAATQTNEGETYDRSVEAPDELASCGRVTWRLPRVGQVVKTFSPQPSRGSFVPSWLRLAGLLSVIDGRLHVTTCEQQTWRGSIGRDTLARRGRRPGRGRDESSEQASRSLRSQMLWQQVN